MRCDITGNLWGTDTKPVGVLCPCKSCVSAEAEVAAVAEVIHDEIGSQICFYAGLPNCCVRKNPFESRPCFCEAAAIAVLSHLWHREASS